LSRDPIALYRNRVLESRELKLRSDLHLSRKAWHVAGISFIIYLFAHLSRQDSLFYLAIAGLIVIPFDILRLKRPDLNHWAVNLFKPVIRIEEVGSISGMAFLIVGTFVTIFVFPPKVAMLALILLAVGDPASSIIGVLYGKDKIWGRKSLQGAMGGFAVCTLAGGIYYLAQNIMVERIVLVSLLTGLIGALSEIIQIKKLDDNMTFPIFAATGLYFLFMIFGGY